MHRLMSPTDPVPGRRKLPRISLICALGALLAAPAVTCVGQTILWNSSSGGAWTNASNWSGGSLPSSIEVASFTLAGTYTVTLGTNETVAALVLNNATTTLQLSGADLSLSSLAGASAITAGTLQLASGSQISTTSALAPYTLANAGAIQSTSGTNSIRGTGGVTNGMAFTNTGSVTVTGGFLTLGSGAGDVVTNLPTGTISANGASSVLTLNGGLSSIINTGTLEATNGGVINLGGNLTTLDLLGTIEIVSSGTINLTGTLNNTLQTLGAPTGGSYTLNGGTISGGTVDGAALTFGLSLGTLGGGAAATGVTMLGNFTVPTSAGFYANSGTLFTGGTTTFNGSNAVHLSAGTANALTIASDETWTGSVSISAGAANIGMTNDGAINNTIGGSLIYGASNAGFSFTNAGTGAVTNSAAGYTLTIGQGGTDQVINQANATINADGGNVILGNGGTTITNAGLLEATNPASTLTIGMGNTTWTNTGTIAATSGGTVDLGGTFGESNLTSGTINAAGGTLNITGTLNNASGTLIPLTGPNSGIYTLYGGTISGGTVDGAALTFGVSLGTLGGGAPSTGVTMLGNFNVPTSAAFYANSGTTFTGGTTTFNGSNAVHLSAGTANALTIASDETWTGSVSISAAGANLGMTNDGALNNTIGGSLIYGASNAGFSFTNAGTGTVTNSATGYTLTIGQGGTDQVINQANATINADGGYIALGNGGSTITNAGLLEATVASSILTIGTTNTTWTNTGTIAATNGGTVDLGGTFGESSLTSGTINASGGTLNLTGTLNNASGTLIPLTGPNSGIYTLYGGIISGGTVDGAALTFGVSLGTLGGGAPSTGVTMLGNFNVPTSAGFYANSGTLFTGGTTTFNGSNAVHLSAGTANALTIASDETWTGGVSISAAGANLGMTNDGALNNTIGGSLIYGASNTGFSFTNAGTGTVTNSATGYTLTIGQGGTDQVINQANATIDADGGNITLGNGGTTITNAGLLEATAASSTLTIGTTNTTWTNTGTIAATSGGTVDLGGTFGESSLTSGTINASGGTLNITGTLNNASGTLIPLTGPNSGIYTLYGGTISGGTVDGAALTFGLSLGNLGGGAPSTGVTMLGNFAVPTSAGFYANSGTTFTGGTTTFNGSNAVHLSAGTANALTIASDETWTGGVSISAAGANLGMTNDGAINNTVGGSLVYGAGNTGFSFTNAGTGTVTNSATGYTLTIGQGGADQVINQANATINADGGNITLGNGGTTITNSGLLEATAATSTLTIGVSNSTWTNTGTIAATNGGIVDLGGNFTDSNLTSGTINASGGTLNITGNLNNASATLVPLTGLNSGIYTLYGGTISGGTVGGGALTFGLSLGTLGGGAPSTGVTMLGNFTVPTSAGFYANSGTLFTGGTTTFNGSNAVHLSAGTANALTIASDEIWTGSVGISAAAANLGLVNNGTLISSGGSNLIYGAGNGGFTFINNGFLEATGGTLTVAQGGTDIFTNAAGATVEASSGNITMGTGGTATVSNLSSNTLTGGTWIALGSATIDFAGTTNTVVTNGSSTTIELSGSGSNIESGPSNHTLEQTLTTNNGTIDVLGGRNFGSTTGAFLNNGTIQLGGGTLTTTGALINGSGSALTGFGTFSPAGGVTIGSGVLLSPGSASANNYVGAMTFNSGTLGTGGAYAFDLENASGAAGTGYDTVNVTGTLNASATSFTVSIESISPGTGTPGLATFNMAQSYQWTLLSAASITGFNPADFTINASAFTNGLGGGIFTITGNSTDIFLNFTPVPEPSTWSLVGLGAAAVGLAALRRRARA